jgi:hypothetical protein
MNPIARLRPWLSSSQSSPSDHSSPATQTATSIQASARSVIEGLTFTVLLRDWDNDVPNRYYAIVNGEKFEVSENALARIPDRSWCRILKAPSGKKSVEVVRESVPASALSERDWRTLLSIYEMLAEAALGSSSRKIKKVLRRAEPSAGGVATAIEQVRSTRLFLVGHSRIERLAAQFQAKLADRAGSGVV